MKTGYTVSDAMTTKPITCSKDSTLIECSKRMLKHDITGLLVVENDVLIGILTESDIVKKAVATDMPHSALVEDIMTTETVTTSPGADISEAVHTLNKYNIHHLPVLEDEKLVGIITLRTILKIEPQLIELLTERIELRGIDPSSPLIESLQSESNEGPCESCGNYSSRLTESFGLNVCPNCKGDA